LIKCCNVLESLLFGHPIWICLLKGRGHASRWGQLGQQSSYSLDFKMNS
jgi:hypothetical protein